MGLESLEGFVEVGRNREPVPSSRGNSLCKRVGRKQGGASERFKVRAIGSRWPWILKMKPEKKKKVTI